MKQKRLISLVLSLVMMTSLLMPLSAFATGVTTITIPSKVKTISEDIFLWCHNLKTINLPDGLENIKHGAFSYCSSLETITIPSKVTSIGYNVFQGCNALTELH